MWKRLFMNIDYILSTCAQLFLKMNNTFLFNRGVFGTLSTFKMEHAKSLTGFWIHPYFYVFIICQIALVMGWQSINIFSSCTPFKTYFRRFVIINNYLYTIQQVYLMPWRPLASQLFKSRFTASILTIYTHAEY